MEFQKDDIITLKIDDMGMDGEGIGKSSGFTFFVKDAVIGDQIEAKVMKVKKGYAYARLTKILVPSIDRIDPKCPYHRQCGGCQIQALDYKAQQLFKERKIKSNLRRIGAFSQELIEQITEPIIGMEEPFFYRNKAQFPIGADKNGNVITGFYAGRTHTIIPNTDCALGVKENKTILEMILNYMRLDSPSTDFVFRKCDLDDMIKQAIRKYAAQFVRRKVALSREDTHAEVVTDEKWLVFVLEQVLSNAIKYTAAGDIFIYLENGCLTVKDTGIGILPEDLPRIFDKGYTGYNGRSDKKASGIGLYLVQKILHKLGHKILVESEPGAGTTVKLLF